MNDADRIALAASCRDADVIPKIDGAGRVIEGPDGRRVQIMHNGVKVFADRYYGAFNTSIIELLDGHHEPQEEVVFFEVLRKIDPGSTMIELGAYWSYYSLWFQHAVPDARNIMIEPEPENLEVGRENFELNGRRGTFELGLVGRTPDDSISPPVVTVDQLMAKHGLENLTILHSDIQGFEFDMLHGARHALDNHKIRFIFISTHGLEIHQRCLSRLRDAGYHLIAEHTPSESYSIDGLIAVSAEREFAEPLPISHRGVSRMGFKDRLRTRLFRMGVHGALTRVFTKRYPYVLRRILG